MNHHRQIIHVTFVALLLAVGYAFVGTLTGVAAQEQAVETKQAVENKKVMHDRGGRDPFKRYEPPAPKIVSKSMMLLPPSIQERIDRYKAQKIAAMNARLQAPKPTTALLLAEVQVIGIFRTPRGYAAMVEALPIKLSYVIYPGEVFFDGQLVAIEENRLVFRREIVWASGKRERVVEIKPLRQPNSVDAMSAAKVFPTAPIMEPEKKPDDKSSAPDKQ